MELRISMASVAAMVGQYKTSRNRQQPRPSKANTKKNAKKKKKIRPNQVFRVPIRLFFIVCVPGSQGEWRARTYETN